MFIHRTCFIAALALLCAVALGCKRDKDDFTGGPAGPGGGGGTSGGGADIDIINCTPATGDTNISGSAVVVTTSADTLSGTPVTRVQVDATTGGQMRQVLVYFETSTGNPRAVTYSWGSSSLMQNVVSCPAAGCSGLTVNMPTHEIFFSNTQLDDNPSGAPTKFATISLGGIQYP